MTYQNQRPMNQEPISNDAFIEWTKDIFSKEHCPGPRKVIVYSVETKQMFVDRGVPEDWIDVMKPLPRKRKKKY